MIKLFPYARIALKHALIKFNFKVGDVILVPDFNCNVIYHPIIDLGITLKFYPILDTFEPNWEKIETLLCKKTKAIMMVHYFGQPQKVENFITFCNNNKLILIEDNSHGHSGTYNNKDLGKFGNIGFTSPRKQLNLEYGALLYINGIDEIPNHIYFNPIISIKTIKLTVFKLISKIFWLKLLLKNIFIKKPDFSNPSEFLEFEIKSAKIDLFSIRKYNKSNWSKIADYRKSNWKEWVIFCKLNNMNPIWDTPNKNTCPWLMPVYVEDRNIRNKILEASWDSGLGFTTWPSLNNSVLNANEYDIAINRWHKLICIPLYKSPNDLIKEVTKFNILISNNKNV